MAGHHQREAGHARSGFFIGSSREALPVAEAFQKGLDKHIVTTVWSEKSVFKPSEYTLDSLERALDRFPYALLILSPDDITHSRGKEETSARDNAIFELGLFVGRHGRRSVYIAVPDSVPMRIPTDFTGMTPVTYTIVKEPGGKESYTVDAACAQILATLKSHRSSAIRRPSPFWDVLSDTIVILYGIDAEIGSQSHPRHRVSRRDLETAWDLQSFLARRYPNKEILPIPATASGWEWLTRTDADLVVVGGFVTNAAFASHRSRYEHFFRVKLGRLCVLEGQRVHHPQFTAPAGCSVPDSRDPQKVEDYPTELTSLDFGFVFNGMLPMYGRDRRVVAIAGVKGHGTRGAARFVSVDPLGIDTQLREPLEPGDTLELAVAAHVFSDVVDHVEPISIILNAQPLIETVTEYSARCELDRVCEGCDFGVPPVTAHRIVTSPRMLTSQIRAIVFDLDDTLIDTFGTLITPLEIQAAKAMIAAGARDRDPLTLASTLLRIRRCAPGDFEHELQRLGHRYTKKVLAVRNRLLTSVPLDHLVLSPEVAQLLSRLRGQFDLYLLTSGAPKFQNQKIDRLEIRSHFSEIVVVTESSRRSKATAIQNLAQKLRLRPENVLVVGNRLDIEIAAGNALGMPTVWIQHGEGSEQRPSKDNGQPDFTLRHVLEIATLLG
jgi:FMN phosphatase YigB (HAD superfamily)